MKRQLSWILTQQARKVFFIISYCIKDISHYLLLFLFMLLISCATSNLSDYGKVVLHSSSNKDSFTFAVTSRFVDLNRDSPIDKKNPKLTKAESKLLKTLLKQKKYCYNKGGNLSFLIVSRQKKIFDVTFSHLIEQNYNARPVMSRTYFGECT